jgi:hypothetical protein
MTELARHSPKFIMKKFYIDIAYVVSVIERKEHRIKQWIGETEADFLIRKLSSDNSPVFSIGSNDHEEFSKLREQLSNEGYILIQRGWHNGDRVIKPFYLNDKLFEEHETFFCAAAMKYRLEHGK